MEADELRQVLALEKEVKESINQNEPVRTAQLLGNLGILYRKAGDFTKALECSKVALGVFHQLGVLKSEATELLLQANTYGVMQDDKNAINCHMQSLKISDELGNELLVAMNCLRVGLTWAVLGMYPEARVMLRYATLLYSNLGQKQFLSDALNAIEKFRTEKLFSSEPQDLALDRIFSVSSSLENIRLAVKDHPLLISPHLLSLLDGANETTVGVRCVVRAIEKQVAMLRLVAFS